jgi:HTH-type transcriptional regulator / antitoxin HigA
MLVEKWMVKWRNYFNQQLKVAFRISLSNVKEPYAISAWLRCGEIEKIDSEVLDYSEKELKNILPEFKEFILNSLMDLINFCKRNVRV